MIGNREPDFLMGISSFLTWKNISLSFLLDIRKGGDIANVTSRSLFSNGQSRFVEKYRNREIVVDGVVEQPDGTFVKNTRPIILDQTNMNTYFYAVSSNFIEDGSYLRMSYVTLGYDFTSLLKRTLIQGLRVSFTGRNLFMLTKYTGGDPQISAGSAGGTGKGGVENFGIPSTRSFDLSLNVTF